MIRNIIFDIGQVLAKFCWREYLEELKFSGEQKERVAKATVEGSYWKELDRGVMPFPEIVQACIGLDPAMEDEIRLFYTDMSTIVKEFEYAEPLVQGLKKQGYRIYVLSNYGERTFSYVENKFRFLPYVDGQVISYQIQHIKPEPEIYQYLLDTYQLKPEESVFLDDVEENLEGARAFGISTIHFTGLAAGLQGLRSLGVTLPDNVVPAVDSVMFDLDGTLWDSTDCAAKLWSEIVKKRGYSVEVTPKRLKQLYGLPLEDIAVQLFPELSGEQAIEIMEECVVEQCPVLSREGGILLGAVEETLRKLKTNYPVFIISNCRSGYIEAFLQAHHLESLITDFACPGDTGKLKADNILLVMERNQVKNPVYIGDTDGDGKAAREAKVPFIFARYGFGATDQYEYCIDSIEELVPLLDKISTKTLE